MRKFNVAAAVAAVLLSTVFASAAPIKWDYLRHPVKVTENRAPMEFVRGLCVESAFDGSGAAGSKPACARAWRQPVVPTEQNPIVCEIDYGVPTAVTALAHYFYVPGNRDFLSLAPAPSAMKKVRISARNDAGESWREIKTLSDLPAECPQVLPTGAAEAWRFWRIEILELAAGAEFLCTYELETYTGGVPEMPAYESKWPDLVAQFAERVGSLKPSENYRPAKLSLAERDPQALVLKTGGAAKVVEGELKLLLDGKPAPFSADGKNRWTSNSDTGQIVLEAEPNAIGMLLKLQFAAAEGKPMKYCRASLQLGAPQPQLYYVPAYAWSKTPVDAMTLASCIQTRMAALGVEDSMLCFFPGTDRGSLGISGGAIRNDLLLGPDATPVQLTVLPGDWWKAYRFAVDEVYGFGEQRQIVPVSEMQYGISRYMLSDEVWEPTLGTVRSWPTRDPHMDAAKYFDAFNLYGATYSIPSYWARYVMNGDELARRRCRSVVQWLCNSGLRIAEGPARGAFFSGQRFPVGQPIDRNKPGCTQASTDILTSQGTGSALWCLLYYRRVSSEKDAEIDRVIDDAADWLLKTQNPDGSWPYGHKPDGQVVPGASSGGSIWNMWSLWRLGKETGEAKYLEAVNRAKPWYLKAFVEPHHYHGYWEDMGPNTREGYDAALAAVVFAEMGEKQASVDCARDAVQWVFTRQLETREACNSAGLVAEQWGWPAAAYCNPMMGLAAYSAWQSSGDGSWRSFAMIPKAVGWWYQPDCGAMVWILDSTVPSPMVGPASESWWCDWCIAQSDTLMLRWLVREMNRRLDGNGSIDEETLRGNVLGEDVHAWAPTGGLRPILPGHGQVNWLGLQNDRTVKIVFMNFGEDGPVQCELNSRQIRGVTPSPKSIHIIENGNLTTKAWDGKSTAIVPRDGAAIFEWDARR